MWHRNCYAQYTSKEKIQRLEQKHVASGSSEAPRNKTIISTSPRQTRSHAGQVNWEQCIFCQNEHSKERLSSVMTFKMSENVIQNAQFNYKVRVRLSGVSDLIAAEAKYHLPCLSAFNRYAEKIKRETKQTDLALVWFCEELEYAADKDHVIKLSDAWERYTTLAEKEQIEIPSSSRRSTFKDKLLLRLANVIDCIPSGRESLLIPIKCANLAVSQLLLTMPTYEPNEDIFLFLVHVALKIRGDLMEAPGHRGFGISEQDAIDCVPDGLFMFLRLLFGGKKLLEGENAEEKEAETRCKVLSIGQDIVFGVSCGKEWTPKHVGLGSTLHQVTRSKDLVRLFSQAGHILNYNQILQVDTVLAESVLYSLDPNTGSVIPPNLVQGKFVHISADNIDILDETMDGKNTFHATQLAAWQRGAETNTLLENLKPSTKRCLNVPESMNAIYPVEVKRGSPVFSKEVTVKNDNNVVRTAQATDVAFNMLQQKAEMKNGWTEFNQLLSTNEQDVTTAGYMPILQAPAHEFDTLNTVVKQCMYIAATLGQKHTVITVDHALYCKLI